MSAPAAPARRTDFAAWRMITLRWSDNDAYGHVNNTVYYQLFDSAVNAMLVDHGLLDITAGDPIALVVSTRCDYFEPVSFPGDVEVGLAVSRVGRSSVQYRIGVFAAGAEHPAAMGEFVHVAVARSDRKPVPWPGAWRQVFDTLTVGDHPAS